AGLLLRKRTSLQQLSPSAISPLDQVLGRMFGVADAPELMRMQLPSLAAIMPYLLLILITTRLPVANPSLVFGLGAFLMILLVGLAVVSEFDLLVPVSLACVLGLEWTWQQLRFDSSQPWLSLFWYFGFYSAFVVLPFVFRRQLGERLLPWSASALS